VEITGQAPTSPTERDQFYREGKQPFSIKIGDKWVSYQQLEPYNQLFNLMANVITAIERKIKLLKKGVSFYNLS